VECVWDKQSMHISSPQHSTAQSFNTGIDASLLVCTVLHTNITLIYV